MANASEALNTTDLVAEDFNLDKWIIQLEEQLTNQLSEIELIEADRKTIGSPESLGRVIEETVMVHINNQISVLSSENFIKENHGLTFDPRNSAHIQADENFDSGRIATHNHLSREDLEHNYDRHKNKPHKEFRKEHVNPGMDKTLQRAGKLNEAGIKTVRDAYSGRQIPTEKGHANSAERDHVNPSSVIYRDAALQMSYTDKELADIINHKDNLVYTAKDTNRTKSAQVMSDMPDNEKTKRMNSEEQKSDAMVNKKRNEGVDRLKQEGKITQKEEVTRMSSSAARAAAAQFVIACLKDLIPEVARGMIVWFKSTQKNIATLLDSLKISFHSFATKLKSEFFSHLKHAGEGFVVTIVSAIFKPIGDIIKKFGTMIKQGFRSLKEAINYLRNPENKEKPLSVKLAQIGKIVVAGLTATGAIALGGVIETGLTSVPVIGQIFSYPIPLVGSLASIIGLFMGALASGVVGAMLLNLIDQFIAGRLKDDSTKQQISKGNETLKTSQLLLEAREDKLKDTKASAESTIMARHEAAAELMKTSWGSILENDRKIAEMKDKSPKNIALSDHDNLFNSISEKLKGI